MFMAVSMVVSTRLVVLAACSMILIILPLTIVLLVLILLSSKLRDNYGVFVTTGHSSNSEDNKVELSYSTQSLLPTVVAMPPPDRTLAPLLVAGCTAAAAGGFGSVVLFAVVLAGVPCSKWLHFEAPVVATTVLFAAAGLTVAGLLGLLAATILPFSLHVVLLGGAMVVDVMFGLWLCVLCQICQIHCYMEE